MTAYQWFTLIQTIVMALAAAGVALIYRGFRTGRWVQNVEAYPEKLAEVHKRIDRAGEKMSELVTHLQGLPDRMHRDFVPRESFRIEIEVAKERQKDFRDEFRKELDGLWKAIREIQNRRR